MTTYTTTRSFYQGNSGTLHANPKCSGMRNPKTVTYTAAVFAASNPPICVACKHTGWFMTKKVEVWA